MFCILVLRIYPSDFSPGYQLIRICVSSDRTVGKSGIADRILIATTSDKSYIRLPVINTQGLKCLCKLQ
ncbi:hypothetical protein QUB13_19740 [Microcoleus sp. B4-D4]